jgi:hypothetical protein
VRDKKQCYHQRYKEDQDDKQSTLDKKRVAKLTIFLTKMLPKDVDGCMTQKMTPINVIN